jgi:hypothetical protein
MEKSEKVRERERERERERKREREIDCQNNFKKVTLSNISESRILR